MFIGGSKYSGGGADPPPGPPAKPTNLSITVDSDTQMTVSWTLNGPTTTSVEIQDRDSDDTWSALSTEAAGATSYTHGPLAVNTMKAYRVRGVNAAGNGPWSDTDGSSDTFIDATTESGNILSMSDAASRVLRAWHKERVAADYAVTLQTHTDTTAGMGDDEAFQLWTVFETTNQQGVSYKGIRAQKEEFLLENIESNSTGKVSLDSGASGSVDGITVNGVQIMSGAESFDTDLNTTATNVAANITANTSSPNYTARAAGPNVIIKAVTAGTGPDGFAVVSSATTIGTTDTNMADGATVRSGNGHRNGWIDPAHTAFLTWLKTPSGYNKYADDAAIYRRAYSIVIADMLEFYADYPTGAQRTDYSGNKFNIWAQVHWMHENHTETGMDVLGANVRWAFEYLLEKLWQGLESLSVGGGGGADMEAFQLAAAPYMVDLGLISQARYDTQVTKVLNSISNPRGGVVGYHHDHGGWTYESPDMSYEGIWLSFLVCGAVAEEALSTTGTILKDALIRHAEMIAYLEMQEYNFNTETVYNTGDWQGRVIGPSSMNTGAHGARPADQYMFKRAELAIGFYTDQWKNRMLGPQYGGTDYQHQKRIKSVADIKSVGNGSLASNLLSTLNGTNAAWSAKEPFYTQPPPYVDEEYWHNPLSMIALHFSVFSGYHATLLAKYGVSDPLEYPPMRRGTAYIKEHGDFKSALIGSMGMNLHFGPVAGGWAGGIASFGGGAITGIWLNDYGTFILGVSSGNQNAWRETWSDYETWAVHAISGEDDSGTPKAFSSARDIGQGLSVTSVGANSIVCTDTDDMSSVFKNGEKFTVQEGANGQGGTSTFTCNGNASWAANVLTITTTETASGLDTGRTRVYSHYFVKNGVTDFDGEYRGRIGPHQGGHSIETGALTAGAAYKRVYAGDANILDVTTSITSDGTDGVGDLWEQIPVYLRYDGDVVSEGGAELTDTSIEYWDGAAWQTLSTTEVASEEIRLGRAGDTGTMDGGAGTGYIYINFPGGTENVRLSSAVHDVNGGGERSRNIKIDLLGMGTLMPATASVNYQIRTTTGL